MPSYVRAGIRKCARIRALSNVEVLIRKFNVKNAEVAALTEATQTQIDGVQRANAAVTGADYSQFSHEEKMQAGLLVNMTLTLAQMINKELELDD